MSRIAYVNGQYVPHRVASVHVEDRGYQFSDGVYEVVLVYGGKMIDEAPHLDRLDRSLDRASDRSANEPGSSPAGDAGGRARNRIGHGSPSTCRSPRRIHAATITSEGRRPRGGLDGEADHPAVG